jgi:uncharacterized protein
MFTFNRATALITGASVGIGEAFANELAERGSNLVLVARSADKLAKTADHLQRTYGISVTVIPADLGLPDAAERIVSELNNRKIRVDLLINNAGFGIFERFLDVPLAKQTSQIDLNVRALLALTHALAPGMVARNNGGIINLASSAAFQPLAGAGVYAASKAFVLSFSEALAQELGNTSVNVLAVCPGPVATQFYAAMNPSMNRDSMDKPATLVKEVLSAFDRGKRLVIPGKLSIRMTAFAVRFLPRRLVAKIAEGTTHRLNQTSNEKLSKSDVATTA